MTFRAAIDWSRLAPLRLRARLVAEGAWAGMHQSPRRGAGVEFGGHRAYTPGDDLRFIDRHALMRHGELMIREFETETDRDLRLLVDEDELAVGGGKDFELGHFQFSVQVVVADLRRWKLRRLRRPAAGQGQPS